MQVTYNHQLLLKKPRFEKGLYEKGGKPVKRDGRESFILSCVPF